MRLRSAASAAVVIAFIARGPSLHAQLPGGLQPQARVDAIVAHRTALHAGAGATIPLGTYARLDLIGALGTQGGDANRSRGAVSGRVDAVGRYLFDPFLESRVGVYAGGGLSARYDRGPQWRGVLVALLGIEGAPRGPIAPFLEIGYGGGLRLGAGIRRSLPGRR